ncbi:MAG: azurin [Gammaproteobacteria bacterium]|nr:azurin [Gammaproteobacteria bacterium]
MELRAFLILACFLTNTSGSETHELHIMKQVFDINTPRADQMYQFVPDYMAIDVGDTARFTGTVGCHTVHGVKGMIPEGVTPISIMPRQPNEVQFTQPGLYGFKCMLHQRRGMVALIMVGKDIHNLATARSSVKKGVSRFTQGKMMLLLDKAESSAAARS